MARPREFDMEKALDAAMSAFWTCGYDATSMADLMEAMDLRKGSIYKAFADKHDLFMQALTRYLDGMYDTMRQGFESAESPVEGLRVWLSYVSQICQGEDIHRGCLALNAAVELGPHDEAVAGLLKRHFARVSRLLTQIIERGQQADEFRRDLPAPQLTKALSIFAAGMLTTSKVLGDEIDPEEMSAFALNMLVSESPLASTGVN
jgi:TetR/AcrR family transcriptional repressor of nem operon